jgi:hypothetical protein
MNVNLESKRKNIERVVKVLGLLVAGFVVAPFVFIAIKGLIGLALAAVVGWGIVFFTPVVAAMMANWRLKALKAEAARNPVETLQNDYAKRQTALAEFRQAIVTFSGEVKNFADKLVDFVKQYPAEAAKFKEQLSKMKQLLALRQKKYTQAQESLVAYELEIQKAGAIWEMGCAAAKMNEAAGMTEDDFLAKIQTETALNSIQTNLNEAFADLEISLLDEDKDKAKEIYAAKQRDMVHSDEDNARVLQPERQKIAVA